MSGESASPAEKPFAPSCERNREPILAVLREHLPGRARLLEIGSGTGQHAVYFAPHFPALAWHCSDRAQHLPGMRMWLEEAALPNTPEPLALDVRGVWPAARFDAVYSANTLHIMAWEDVVALFAALPGCLTPEAMVLIYGPFSYGGTHTSESNAAFDAKLRADAPHMGVRDFEAVDALAQAAGLALLEDRAMPANNRMLIWRTRGV